MKKPLPVLFAFGFLFLSIRLAYSFGDSTKVYSVNDLPNSIKTEVYRTFESIGSTQIGNTSLDPIIISNSLLADSTLQRRHRAEQLSEEVTSSGRFVESLTSLSDIDLPVGIRRTGGSADYTILIEKITFTTRGAVMEVYVSLKLPMTGDPIAFYGKIPVTKEGGIAGTARIFLVGDHQIKLSETAQFTLKGTRNTFVEFNCSGFIGMGIESEVEFSRDLIVPEDQNGKVPNDGSRVKVKVDTYLQSLNNIMLGVTIPSFQVKGLNGFGFTVIGATMDWSDSRNPTELVFPKDYTSPFIEGGQPLLWQGFFLNHLEVRFPESFGTDKSDGTESKRIKIEVDHMILDDEGFSGLISVSPVLSLGDMSGWSYSINKFGLEFVTNKIRGFVIDGTLTIPVIKSKDGKVTQFAYLAQRGADGNYIFAVTIQNDLKFPLFVADLKLFPGSTVIVAERDDKFYPTAILNGEISIKAAKTAFNSLRFEGLKISSDDPHFDLQAIGFGKDGATQSMSNYPLSITNIMLKKKDNRIGIGFDITINIGGKSEEGGFGGTAALIVWGKQEPAVAAVEGETTASKRGDWQFDKVELSGIGVNFKKAGVIEIAGMIRFFEDDPVYGDGFKGSISGKIQVITLQVEALFGKTPTYRYWFADAMVEFQSGLPLVSGFSAYGFGGGFYSKMKQSTGGISSPIGMTASGVTYVPDENTFGIKAMVKFGCTGNQMPYNGDVTLEVELNRHGGINSVTFTGNLNALTPPPIVQAAIVAKEMVAAAINSKDGNAMDKFSDPTRGAVSAHVKILFDNVNHVFHANMEMYINVLGGVVKGVGQNNRAGWAVMHFEKNDWYVLIGTPDDPVGVEILWMLKMKSYFMLGKHLPGSPPPPRQVSEILGIDREDLDYMRDLNAIESGLGFAFGMNFSMDTGDLRFLMFYGRFAAGIGTDFMLKQYSKDYHCVGSDEPVGINGWYANGQAYAYIQGNIGVKVNLPFYKGDYDILSIGAAAILQAKGPNPFWMRGIVGGYYKILGGLVKGNCKFEMVIGKDCNLVANSSPLENVNIISQVSPVTGSHDVDVFNAPQAAFNIPIEEIFEITDSENRKHIYRGHLKVFNVLDGTSPIEGGLRWNESRDVVVFDSRDVFPSKKELKATVTVTFEENLSGTWKTAMFEGKPAEETLETTFTTGVAPDHIRASNVAYSYPVVGQYNFYPKEYNSGFIKLKKGQPELFTLDENWIQKIHYTDASGEHYLESEVAYSAADMQVNFSLPSSFQPAKVYHFEILNIPAQQRKLDTNVSNVETKIATGSDDNDAVLNTKKIEGSLELRDVKPIYSSFFRTSKYATFVDKMKSMTLSDAVSGNAGNNVLLLGAYWRGDEYFDDAEIGIGVDKLSQRLVTIEADLIGNAWYESKMYPLIYEGYPLMGLFQLRKRNTEILGLPPVREVFLGQDKNGLSVSNIGEAPNPSQFFSGSRIEYELPQTMFSDYLDIQNQAANYALRNDATPRITKLILTPYPLIGYGAYKVRLAYRIPGINLKTSDYNVTLLYSKTRSN